MSLQTAVSDTDFSLTQKLHGRKQMTSMS